MRRFALLTVTTVFSAMLFAACTDESNDQAHPDTTTVPPRPVVQVPQFTVRVVHQYPHDTSAFTQGLVFHEGKLLESTGRPGLSSLREVDIESGRVIRRFEVPAPYFAEGLALVDAKLYQLTWQNYMGFVYDLSSFRQIDTFRYYGEGWGLTTDGERLVMSDGTAQIRFLKPDDATILETLNVKIPGGPPVSSLNELEWIDGEIWANVYQTDRIVKIDPVTGAVTGIIDLSGLLPNEGRTGREDVLNGIAYDPATKRLFVTGKLWPLLFEIEIVPRAV